MSIRASAIRRPDEDAHGATNQETGTMNDSAAINETAQIEDRTAKKGFSRFAPTGARVVMGLLFFVMGLNGLLQFLPPPKPGEIPPGAMELTLAFARSGYMMQLVGVTQIVVGALLLANRFVPLALVILAPVVVNIIAFHLFLAPQGLPVALVVLALGLYLAKVHAAAFRSLLAPRA
ncbi:hypothetical protein AKJ09_01602 [Labilithrix luteola]|uniref:DoxX family protein n=1 Tax=Labilithrix luteola TaxID=1391654 RepID=A0A0K1PN33_9BACT|nr:DoxX family protein [Labilithrix luteola]AKU94938.1 hypothetical protein AKJ09_01602 [Labilithrix luteola]